MTSPNSTYITASVFSLAHPYGTPTVLSSFSYTSYDDGAPNNGEILICWLVVFLWLKVVFIPGSGTCDTTGGKNGWYCQHRLTAISGMVGFRNAVGSAPMTNWTSPQSQQIAFGRGFILHYFLYSCSTDFFFLWGSIGFVAINNVDSVWTTSFSTSLPDGQYCDVISGTGSSGKCTGTTYVILVCSLIFFWH